MIIVIMGVAGSGKTTIGKLLSKKFGYKYYEGDDYHPHKNVAKMSNGIPLNDEDRLPWLLSLRKIIQENLEDGRGTVITCSALKQSYREILKYDNRVKFVYLKGDFDTINNRMQQRKEHFMKPEMLKSQFDALEEPTDAITIEVNMSTEEIVNEIIKRLEELNK
jgi:gluconokinase